MWWRFELGRFWLIFWAPVSTIYTFTRIFSNSHCDLNRVRGPTQLGASWGLPYPVTISDPQDRQLLTSYCVEFHREGSLEKMQILSLFCTPSPSNPAYSPLDSKQWPAFVSNGSMVNRFSSTSSTQLGKAKAPESGPRSRWTQQHQVLKEISRSLPPDGSPTTKWLPFSSSISRPRTGSLWKTPKAQ